MAEESFQEKTEEATPKRREDARRKGQVARSNELSSVAILTAGLLTLSALGHYIFQQLSGFMLSMFTEGFAIQLDALNIQMYALTWAARYLAIVGPFVAVLVVTALAINYVQVGVMFSTQAMAPKFNRLSPLSGLKKIVSAKGLVELAKSLFKVGAVALITYITINSSLDQFIGFMDMNVAQILSLFGESVLRLGYRVTLLLLIMAILDYTFQRFDYEKSLRMTRQEVREELKQQEGDPMVRSRIRTLQREMSRRRMMSDVGTADVVVTNPTHVAVALKYDPEAMQAPLVVAKGQRLIAQRIKELAREAGVPLVENKPLARALFAAVRIGDEVPEDLFRAVAQVLAFVFGLRRRSASQ
jgi:flagellar biosynthesis protein FlhB